MRVLGILCYFAFQHLRVATIYVTLMTRYRLSRGISKEVDIGRTTQGNLDEGVPLCEAFSRGAELGWVLGDIHTYVCDSSDPMNQSGCFNLIESFKKWGLCVCARSPTKSLLKFQTRVERVGRLPELFTFSDEVHIILTIHLLNYIKSLLTYVT